MAIPIKMQVIVKLSIPAGMAAAIASGEYQGKKLKFSISAENGIDKISEGIHERYIIDAKGFNEEIGKKVGKFS